ncbi:hypothetical protein AVEN_3459-1 [Araneus ventricosus]|uniref:Uncharacterized protein n=1 Tax=Araneus ventricosus TaxID=182803 RepID=A0A4Y2BAD5_ARAVE|nr:hypothetical protein AVEN_3459-1 [Araneus ventricosus]
MDCGRWNSEQWHRSYGAWLGKRRVARGSYLWTVVGEIPNSRAIPTARGFRNLESLEVRTHGLWSVEFRTVAPVLRRAVSQTSSRPRFILMDCGRWNSEQSRHSFAAWLGKSLSSTRVDGCTDAVCRSPFL